MAEMPGGRSSVWPERRRFLAQTGGALLCGIGATATAAAGDRQSTGETIQSRDAVTADPRATRLCLCGDVMTGRGIDQIQRHPGDPRLFEPWMKSSLGYVEIAEQASGPIPRGVAPAYVWGDALAELERARPAARIVNLETAVTTASDAWPGKGIHYRMHPANVDCLSAAGIDCCTLANNHVLDWGYEGLKETIDTLRAAGIQTAGAGADAAAAAAPVAIKTASQRVLLFAFGCPSSGVPEAWAAGAQRSGVNLLDEFSSGSVAQVAGAVAAAKRSADIAVVSIHWGSNWGYDVPAGQRLFARRLIDEAGVDVVYGHSSHHPRPIEVYRDRLILYGCGDLLNDYEGIGGHAEYRPDLCCLYLPEIERSSGRLLRLVLFPLRVRKFRLNRASAEESAWLLTTMNRECRAFGTRFEVAPDRALVLSVA